MREVVIPTGARIVPTGTKIVPIEIRIILIEIKIIPIGTRNMATSLTTLRRSTSMARTREIIREKEIASGSQK